MVQLIVEDGTGKPDANSYATLEQAKAFADSRGIELPSDDEMLTRNLILAADFLNSYESRFKGHRSFLLNPQALSFPRDGVTMFDNEMPAAFMPPQLIGAQVAVIQAITAGVELFPVQSGAAVTEETVGPITTKYDAGTWDASDLPVLSMVENILKPLFDNSAVWQTVRV